MDLFRQLPPDLQRRDQLSREQWATAAARALLHTLRHNRVGLLAIVAAGKDEFVRNARRVYADDELRTENFEYMFQVLARAARALQG